MLPKTLIPAVVLAGLVVSSGCVGSIPRTTTDRTSTELLLLSAAAERALERYDASELAGMRVAIDGSHFDSVDKPYVLSALRHRLAEAGAVLVSVGGTRGESDAGSQVDATPERVVEARNGALGIYEKSFGFGIPALPLPIPQTSISMSTPPIYLFFRDKQEGWAKFQLWVRDPENGHYVSRSPDLWGYAYHSQWWVLGVGPFDWSNDIYPDPDMLAIPAKPEP